MSKIQKKTPQKNTPQVTRPAPGEKGKADSLPKEIGGREGPEPTRYGDWEKNGIISDF